MPIIQPHFTIRVGDEVYLRRWHLAPRNRWFSVYLHNFLRSDDVRALHDHPYANASLLLRGSYVEHTPNGSRLIRPWRLVRRSAVAAHRVELIEERPVWSLFFVGRRVREWGFHCPKGWRHWKEYVRQVPGGNAVGRGCD